MEEQAIDRVHRLNQTQDVIVYKMTIKDSVEERILNLQERKRELANTTLEGKMAASKLGTEEIMKLFRHEAEAEHPVDGIGMGLEGGSIRIEDLGLEFDSTTDNSRYGDRYNQHIQKAQQDARARSGYSSAYDRRW